MSAQGTAGDDPISTLEWDQLTITDFAPDWAMLGESRRQANVSPKHLLLGIDAVMGSALFHVAGEATLRRAPIELLLVQIGELERFPAESITLIAVAATGRDVRRRILERAAAAEVASRTQRGEAAH